MSYAKTVGNIYRGLSAPASFIPKKGYKKGAIRGALGGAAAGTALLPGVGTIIGAGVGALAGWLSDDPEEQLRQRKEAMIAEINATRASRMAQITKESANARGASAQAAMARAIDTGRDPSDIEDSLLVANQQNTENANSAINQANQYFDQQVLDVNGEYNSRPLEQPLSDTLLNAGADAVAGYYQSQTDKQQQDYIDAYKKSVQASTTSGIPSVTPSTTPSVQTGQTEPIRMPLNFDNLAVTPEGLLTSPNARYIQSMKSRSSLRPAVNNFGRSNYVPKYGY